MFRVSSLGGMSTRQVDRLALRLAALLVVGLVAFAVFYFVDRTPSAGPSLVDRQVQRAEEAVRSQPDDVGARLQLAGLYTAARRYDEAAGQYAEVLKVEPANRHALLGRGGVLFSQGDLAGATDMYTTVVGNTADGEFAGVDPQLEEARYFLGTIALKEGDPATAVGHFEAAVKIESTDADALVGLGTAYLATDRAADAVEPLRRAASLVPQGWSDPYARLAEAYSALGRTADAAAANAMVAFAEGRLEEAKAGLAPLAGSADASLDTLLGMAMTTELLGDRDAALSWYQKVLALEPDNFGALQGTSRLGAGDSPDPGASAPAGHGG